jgi:hypothetical protein
VRLTNERVGVFLARRSVQHLVCLEFKNGYVPQKDYNTEINMQSCVFKPQENSTIKKIT